MLKELKDKVYSVLLGSKHMQTTVGYKINSADTEGNLSDSEGQESQQDTIIKDKLLGITANTVKYNLVPAPIRRALGIDQPEKPKTIVRLSAVPLIEGLVYSSLLFQEMLFTSIKNRLTDTFSKDSGFRPLQRVKSFLQSITMIGISGLMVMVSTIYALPLLIKLPVQSIISYINVIKRLREEIKALKQTAESMTPVPAAAITNPTDELTKLAALEEQLAALQKELAAAETALNAGDMAKVLNEGGPEANADPLDTPFTEENQVDKLEATIRQLEIENQRLTGRLSEIEDAQPDYNAHQITSEAQAQRIAELEALLAHHESKTRALNDSGFEGDTSGDESERVGVLEDQLRLANERASTLSELLQTENQHNKKLTTTNELLQTKVADLTSALGEVDPSLSGRLKEALAEVRSLRDELANYKGDREEIEQTLIDNQKTIAKLKQELSKATDQSPSARMR